METIGNWYAWKRHFINHIRTNPRRLFALTQEFWFISPVCRLFKKSPLHISYILYSNSKFVIILSWGNHVGISYRLNLNMRCLNSFSKCFSWSQLYTYLVNIEVINPIIKHIVEIIEKLNDLMRCAIGADCGETNNVAKEDWNTFKYLGLWHLT